MKSVDLYEEYEEIENEIMFYLKSLQALIEVNELMAPNVNNTLVNKNHKFEIQLDKFKKDLEKALSN